LYREELFDLNQFVLDTIVRDEALKIIRTDIDFVILLNLMDQKIVNYISKNKVLTLATSINDKPHCANCFYVFDEVNKILIFLSDTTTQHIKEAIQNNTVAGTINTEVTTVAKIRGIQFMGNFVNPSKEQQKDFYSIYYKKFPFAKAKPAKIWGVQLSWIKMTDNTLGFGKKLIWER